MAIDWKDIAGMVGKAAPLMGTLLAGPAGGAVGSIIGAALGTDDADQTAAVLAGDPAALLKLKEIEELNKTELLKLSVQAEANRLAADTEAIKVAAADRADARKSAVDGGIHRHVFWLTVLIFVVVVSVEAAALLLGIPAGLDGQMVGRILGTLDATLLAALYYTYGSSAGSARKDEMLAGK